jgi:hypothetical protein
LGDGIIIADCHGIRTTHFKLGYIYASFDSHEVREAIEFVKAML